MAKLQRAQKAYGLCIGKNLVYGDMTGTDYHFQVTGGPIRIHALGFLVTTLTAGTNTMKFQFTPYDGATAGSAQDLCGATDTDAADVGQLFTIDGVQATALEKGADVGVNVLSDMNNMPVIVGIGKVSSVWSASSTAGAGVIFMEYSPLSQFSNVSIV